MPQSSRPTLEQRNFVAGRANHRCEYCQSLATFAPYPFSIEHIHPKSKGGVTDVANLALACQGCNNFKFTKTELFDSISGEMAPIFHPRNNYWLDHFAWVEGGLEIVGLTATGRATIEGMRLNREPLVNYRGVLALAGVHPPESYPDD